MKKPVFDDEAYEYFRHPGDPEPSRQTLNGRWGDVQRLLHSADTNKNRSFTMIMVPATNTPRPVAFQIRFSLDGVTWHATNPSSTADARFKFTSQIHLKSGEITDQFLVTQGNGQPFSQLITTGLTMSVSIESSYEFGDDYLWVAVTACPVCCVDDDVSPGGSVAPSVVRPQTYGTSNTLRISIADIAAASPPDGTDGYPALDAETARAQFFVHNKSDVDVMMAFGPASMVAGEPFGVSVLEPGATYESPPGGYNGIVRLACLNTDVDEDGYVLVTHGEYPS